MTHYYIFKTDRISGKTTHICNGAHETIEACSRHWLCYMYGFMDAAFELVGRNNFDMTNEKQELNSFQLKTKDGCKDVEYFMLLDKEGRDLISELSKQD